jgi:hypothetical protein
MHLKFNTYKFVVEPLWVSVRDRCPQLFS